MAYIVKQIGDNYNQPTYYFECDDIEDLDNIPLLMVPMGSRCFVINEGVKYALNSKQEWKVVKDGAVSEEDKEEDTEPEEVRSNAVEYVEQTLTEEQQMTARKNLGLYFKETVPTEGELVYDYLYIGWWEVASTDTISDGIAPGKYVISAGGTNYECVVCEYDLKNEQMVGYSGNAFLGNAEFLPYTPSETAMSYSNPDCPVAFHWVYNVGELASFNVYIDPEFSKPMGTTIEVYTTSDEMVDKYHQIPNEYISDEIPRQTDLNQMEASIYNNLGDAVKTTRQDLSSTEKNMARYNLGLYHDYLIIVDDEEWNFESGRHDFTISTLSKGQQFNIRINGEFGTGIAEHLQGGSAAPSHWEIVFSFDNQPDWNVSYSEYGGFFFSALDENDTYVSQEGNFTIYLAAHDSYISSNYLPSDVVYEHDLPSKIPYIADATDTVTVEQFNALLQALRDYGYMEQEAN